MHLCILLSYCLKHNYKYENVTLYSIIYLYEGIIIIIIIIIPYFTAVQLVLKTVRVSLTKHFLFTVLPKLSDYTACIKYYCFTH